MYRNCEAYRNDLENAFQGTVNFTKLYHKSILVTGATGLIGSFLADLLLYANRTEHAKTEIFLLARDEKRIQERFVSYLGEKTLHCILQNVEKPLELPVPVDYIVHAAGDGFPSAFREHPVETMTPALCGTFQLLQYAKENSVEKFLYVSSGEVYGGISGQWHAFTEQESGALDSMDVRSCYPMAKRCAETLCASFGMQYHVPVAVVRPSHTYGACTSAHDNRATAQFLAHAAAGENIILHSAGEQMRSYTYVADCVSAILTVLLNGENGKAYNIANPASRITIAGFAGLLAREAGVDCIRKEPDENEKKEHTPIRHAVLDSSRLERLGWSGRYDLNQGIARMLEIRKAAPITKVREGA